MTITSESIQKTIQIEVQQKVFICRYVTRSRIFLYFYHHDRHKRIIIILCSIYTLTDSYNYISLGTSLPIQKNVIFTHDLRY